MDRQRQRVVERAGQESYLAPTLHGELELSHEYADFVKFPTENLVDRMNEVEQNLLNNWYSERAVSDLKTIVDRLCFEIQKRSDEARTVYMGTTALHAYSD